jgi:hypothetical protein
MADTVILTVRLPRSRLGSSASPGPPFSAVQIGQGHTIVAYLDEQEHQLAKNPRALGRYRGEACGLKKWRTGSARGAYRLR